VLALYGQKSPKKDKATEVARGFLDSSCVSKPHNFFSSGSTNPPPNSAVSSSGAPGGRTVVRSGRATCNLAEVPAEVLTASELNRVQHREEQAPTLLDRRAGSASSFQGRRRAPRLRQP